MQNKEFKIKVFNQLFVEFCNALCELFPTDVGLITLKTGLEYAISANPNMVVAEFNTNIKPYEAKIIGRDEQFFLNDEFKEAYSHDGYISAEIQRISDIWKDPNTAKDTKEMIWKYMTKLIKVNNMIHE